MTYINRLLRYLPWSEKDDSKSTVMMTSNGTYIPGNSAMAQWRTYFAAERSEAPGPHEWVDKTMFKTEPTVIDGSEASLWFYMDYIPRIKRVFETDDGVVNGKLTQVTVEREVVDYVWAYRSVSMPRISLKRMPLLVRKEPDYHKREIGYKGVHVLSDPVNMPGFKEPNVFMPLTVLGLGEETPTPMDPLETSELPSPPYSPFAYSFNGSICGMSSTDSPISESMSGSTNADDEEAELSPGILSFLTSE
jgi:hypothetical protein